MRDDSKLDDLLTQLGTGRWNMFYFIGAALWYLLIPAQFLSVVYLAPVVNHTCLPSLDHKVSHISEDSCSYFRSTPEGLQEEECVEWLYDDSTFSSTLTSEFGLVCGNAYLRATYQSLYTLSSIIGSMVSGYVADKYGRKRVLVVSQVLYAIICISISFITNFRVILAFRFILGILMTPTFYMMGMEVCETKWRSVVGIVMVLPWAFGMMLWGGAGYLVRDWRWLHLLVSLPILPLLPVLFLIDESPRWLIVTGRHEKALKVLRRASRLNKTTLPPDDVLKPMIEDIHLENDKQEKTDSAASLGKRKAARRGRCTLSPPRLLMSQKMRIVTLALSVILFISELVYSGLSLSATSYSNDPFLYMVLTGLMEVPGYTVTAPIIKRWGRKVPTMIGYVICGVAILSLAVIPKDITWLVMTLAMVGKLAISGSFMMIFVYEAELLPTEVRLQGVAVTMVASGVASSISPYITDYLSPLVPWLPSAIFGVSSFVASLVLLPLPETLGRALPDTIEDLEILWRKTGTRVDAEDESQTEKLTA